MNWQQLHESNVIIKLICFGYLYFADIQKLHEINFKFCGLTFIAQPANQSKLFPIMSSCLKAANLMLEMRFGLQKKPIIL